MPAIPMLAQDAALMAKMQAKPAVKINANQAPTVVVIKYKTQFVNANPRYVTYKGDVQATYGVDILNCDQLTLDLEPGHEHLLAEGNVVLNDPDGMLHADRLFYDWINETGSGEQIHVMAHNVMIDAKSVIIHKKSWELDTIFATPCGREKTQLFAIRAPRATITPGGNATIYRPRIYVLGRKIITLSQYRVSSDRRSSGLAIPTFSYSKSSGLSGGWQPSLFLNDTTALNSGIHLGQHSKPSEDMLLSHSLLSSDTAPGAFTPRSDFAERFDYSYFDNVYVGTPMQERGFTTDRRTSISAATLFNEYPSARLAGNSFDKPFELIFENAAGVGKFGTYEQIRAQQIKETGGVTRDRVLGQATVMMPTIDLTRGLYTDVRVDGFAAEGPDDNYGWGHLQLGLVARPVKALRLGAAYTTSTSWGTPSFDADRLYKTHSINLRADVLLGPTRLNFIAKYDPIGQRWWDTEFQISQVAGCIVPYIVYRQFPRSLGFGFSFRTDDLLDAIRRRQNRAADRNQDYH
jgi:hypothetical protein